MAPPRSDSSAESAARFLASRKAKSARRGRPPRQRVVARRVPSGFSRPRKSGIDDRLLVDLHRKTLLAIHEALCDAMAPPDHRPNYNGEMLHAIVIAEQMISRALGLPDCDDPPLTDRESR